MDRKDEAPRSVAGEVEFGHVAPGFAVVTLRGEHDLSTMPVLSRALERAAAHSNVLVDLADCSLIDSTVISAFIKTAQALQRRGERFVLVIPPEQPYLNRIANLTRLDHIFPIFSTRTAGEQEIERVLKAKPPHRWAHELQRYEPGG